MKPFRARLTLRLLAVAAFPPFSLLLSGQEGTGSVSGVVICGDSNAPARGADVALVPLNAIWSDNSAGTVDSRTDFSGTYQIGSIRAGTYVVFASNAGYADDLRLQRSASGGLSADERKELLARFPQVIVRPGSDVRKDLVLRRAAAISGQLSVDMGGIPGVVIVTAARISGQSPAGVPANNDQESKAFTRSAMADDRGVYRIAGLPAGKYQISLRLSEAFFGFVPRGASTGKFDLEAKRPGTAELTVYAPEALETADARTITVDDGDEITDVDIVVPTRKLHSLGGIVMDGGVPRAGIAIEYQRDGASAEAHNAVSTQDGSYRFDLLPSGRYTLRTKAAGDSGAFTGQTSVELQDTDIVDANIELRSTTARPK